MDGLRALLRRMQADLPRAQRASCDERELEHVALDAQHWAATRDSRLDLALLCRLHVAVTREQTVVRRADGDGRWVLADARPGLLRTKPQRFRIADHGEPAWPHGELKAGLIRLFAELAPRLESEPVRCVAHLLWALSRAQPFAGHNVETALAIASWALRRAGLPVLPATLVARNPELDRCLVAAGADDRSALEHYLAVAVWEEALRFVEWLGPPPGDPVGWTLRADHAWLAERRARTTKIAQQDLEALADRATDLLNSGAASRLARLGPATGPCERRWLATHAERLQAAWHSAARERRICPHEPVLVTRWPVGDHGLRASVTLAAAGCGISGAASLHFAIEPTAPLTDQPIVAPAAGAAPALLIIPDEPVADRDARLIAWIEPAVARALQRCPLRA